MHRWADEVLLIAAIARYLTARYQEAAAAAAEGMASGRNLVVHLWGLVILIETALRANPDDPALAGWSEEATRLLPKVARIDAAASTRPRPGCTSPPTGRRTPGRRSAPPTVWRVKARVRAVRS
jgi:hypothetical protein